MPLFYFYRHIIFYSLLLFSFLYFLFSRNFLFSFSSSSSSSSPSISQNFPSRLIAIADLHGDYEHALKTLEIAKLIHPTPPETPFHKVSWISKNTLLVQTGDVVDRGPDTDKIYKLLHHLSKQAILQGGNIIRLWGNHEFMNAMGDWRYVDPKDIENYGNAEKRRQAWSSNGWIGNLFMEYYNVTFTHQPLGSFVHGGIHPFFASLGTDHINTIGRSMMKKLLDGKDWSKNLDNTWTIHERQLYNSDGPLWYRGYALDENEIELCKRAEKAMKALKVNRLIMGHTPHLPGIQSRCNSKVLIIDTGISRAYGGALSALEIIPRLGYSDLVTALYQDHSEILSG